MVWELIAKEALSCFHIIHSLPPSFISDWMTEFKMNVRGQEEIILELITSRISSRNLDLVWSHALGLGKWIGSYACTSARLERFNMALPSSMSFLGEILLPGRRGSSWRALGVRSLSMRRSVYSRLLRWSGHENCGLPWWENTAGMVEHYW